MQVLFVLTARVRFHACTAKRLHQLDGAAVSLAGSSAPLYTDQLAFAYRMMHRAVADNDTETVLVDIFSAMEAIMFSTCFHSK
jgi:hypothetical protein